MVKAKYALQFHFRKVFARIFGMSFERHLQRFPVCNRHQHMIYYNYNEHDDFFGWIYMRRKLHSKPAYTGVDHSRDLWGQDNHGKSICSVVNGGGLCDR